MVWQHLQQLHRHPKVAPLLLLSRLSQPQCTRRPSPQPRRLMWHSLWTGRLHRPLPARLRRRSQLRSLRKRRQRHQ